MISVIIVTKLSRPEELRKCLDALKQQTFRDFETVIVVPRDADPQINGSTVIKQDGVGICNARNCGVKHAKGNILAFTDDDAEPYSDWLEKISKHFHEDSELDYLGGDFTLQPHSIWQRWINKRYHLSAENVAAGLCQGNNMAYKREVFDAVVFDENILFGDDEADLQRTLQTKGFQAANFKDVLIRHQHRSSFWGFTKMRWGYGQGHSYVYEVKLKQSLFHWQDLLNITLLLSLFYASLLTFSAVWFWVFPITLFMLVVWHGKKQDASIGIWLVDIYVSMLWTLSKLYYSFKYHLKRWGLLR